MRGLLHSVWKHLVRTHAEGCAQDPPCVARAALHAAEANGAVPPLSSEQRAALRAALAGVAQAMAAALASGEAFFGEKDDSDDDDEEASSSMDEDLIIPMRPLLIEALGTAFNAALPNAGRGHSGERRGALCLHGVLKKYMRLPNASHCSAQRPCMHANSNHL